MYRLRNLDLFSGIGGFSYALRSVAKTVAYCEIDDNCRAVLEQNMTKNRIDHAHIFQDVTNLTKSDLEKLRPNMITAGFPCTDISSANPNGLGLNGLRSGLFSEILRIIDQLRTIDIVFLENSPRILNKGYDYIKAEMERRGYICEISQKEIRQYITTCLPEFAYQSFLFSRPSSQFSRSKSFQRFFLSMPLMLLTHLEMLVSCLRQPLF